MRQDGNNRPAAFACLVEVKLDHWRKLRTAGGSPCGAESDICLAADVVNLWPLYENVASHRPKEPSCDQNGFAFGPSVNCRDTCERWLPGSYVAISVESPLALSHLWSDACLISFHLLIPFGVVMLDILFREEAKADSIEAGSHQGMRHRQIEVH